MANLPPTSALKLTPFSAAMPIVDPGSGVANQTFVTWWNNLLLVIQSNLNAVTAAETANTTATAAIEKALSQANIAVVIASNAQLAAASALAIPPSRTFAELPPSPYDGQSAFITDATSAVFAAAAAGGGANHVPVYYDGAGAVWRVG